MDLETEIRETKSIRQDIDKIIQRVKSMPAGRESSITVTKLQEAVMWQGMNLKRLGTPNPYPESKNPNSLKIEPTSNGLKM